MDRPNAQRKGTQEPRKGEGQPEYLEEGREPTAPGATTTREGGDPGLTSLAPVMERPVRTLLFCVWPLL